MLLLQFAVLQIADVVTTLVFLGQGVAEGNPLMRFVMGVFGGPAAGLAVAKILSFLMAWGAWHTGRLRVLRWVNAIFTACVLWNVAAILCKVA